MGQNTKNLTLIALFASVLALSAFLRVPAGPVPLTLQSAAALLCGYCLGPSRGALAALLYTSVGLLGLPVFASGGGPAYLFSPTFGYILGFTACASVTGALARLNSRGLGMLAYFIMLAGLVSLYVPGFLWFYWTLRFVMGTPSSVASIIRAGLIVPFIGDLITTVPAALVAVKLRPAIQREQSPRGSRTRTTEQ